MRPVLRTAAALLTVVCVVPYLIDTFRGTTRPQRTSWFVFTVLSLVACVSQFADGTSAGAWLTAGATVGFGAVFIASLSHGVGGGGLLDVAALMAAALGLALWYVTDEPLAAVLAVIVAELAAVGLTARKAAGLPETETASTWLIDAAAGAVALCAVAEWSFLEVVYPAYHMAANLVVSR